MGLARKTSRLTVAAWFIVGLIICVAPAWAGKTTRVSVATDGTPGNQNSEEPCLSADGRYVAFTSWASNLVTGDSNAVRDVFVHDRATGETTRVSVASDGSQGNGTSQYQSISGDGRYVAFQSYATNLVAADTNGCCDIFRHDRQTGQTIRVSVSSGGAQADQACFTYFGRAISHDGRYVVFESGDADLAAGPTVEGTSQIFLRDCVSGTTSCVSMSWEAKPANNTCRLAAISSDGSHVAFASWASNLVENDTNLLEDVFVVDRVGGGIRMASRAWDGALANQSCAFPVLSEDGRYVAFHSTASNLVADDTNGAVDVFLRDLDTNQITRVSLTNAGGQVAGQSSEASLSGDGSYVAFCAVAANIHPTGQTNWNSYVRDRAIGETVLMSKASDGTPAANSWRMSRPCSISANGRYVAFESQSNNLVVGDSGVQDIFVHDRLFINPPTDVTAAFDGTSQVDVSWTDNADNEHGFTIQRRKYDSTDGWPATWTTVKWLGANATSWSDTSLAGEGQYQYRVRAFNAAGPGNWAPPARVLVCLTRPPTPTNFTAQMADANTARLTWTDNSDINKGFTLQRRQWATGTGWPAAWTTRRWLGPNVETYDDALTEDGIYQYRVRAYNSVGPGNWARPRCVTRATASPDAPSDLTLTAVATGIRADWTANATNARGYLLQKRKRNLDGTWPGFTTVKWLGATVASFTDTNLSGNGWYQYRVRAYNAVGPSAWAPYARIDYAGAPGMPGALCSVAVTQANGQFVNIVYGLSAEADITIEVRNIAGRLVRAIPCGTAAAGLSTATWNLRSATGAPVPSGVYLCAITARSENGTQATAVRTVTIRR